MRVFALAMSMPDSTMVVQTRTSICLSQKSTMTCSSAVSFICPWATAMRASGTSSPMRRATRSIDSTRLCTKNTWPSRMSSRLMAAAICLSS